MDWGCGRTHRYQGRDAMSEPCPRMGRFGVLERRVCQVLDAPSDNLPPEDPWQLRNVSMGQNTPRMFLLTTVGLYSYKRLRMQAIVWDRQVFCAPRCTSIIRAKATPCENMYPKQEN